LSYMIDRKPDRDVYSPVLWIDPGREERAAGILGKKPTLAVAPIANWKGKQWPVEYFIQVIRDFLERNGDAQAAIFAAPQEKEQLGLFFDALEDYAVLDMIQPDIDLLTAAACIRQCRLFLGNDSGLMHISAAVNTPTIGLFGPSDECVYGPWSPLQPSPHAVIRGEGVRNLADLEARPGFSYEKKDVCYMTEIRSDKVLDVVLRKWKGEMLFHEKRYPAREERRVQAVDIPDLLGKYSLAKHD